MIDKKIWERWRSLQDGGTDELLIQLMELYLDTSGSSVTEIETALSKGYEKGVAFHAHGLKSSSASLGATQLSDFCLEMETRGRENKLNGAQELFAQLKYEHEQVVHELSQELIQLKKSA